MRFWEIAVRNVLRKQLRSLFAMLGIALTTAVYVGMTNLVGGIAANSVSHRHEGCGFKWPGQTNVTAPIDLANVRTGLCDRAPREPHP
jgi:hypothetical protein